jgi:hypothetical protein
MKRLPLRYIPLLAILAVTGCANVKLDTTGATPSTVESLRTANLSPAQVGSFVLAPGKDPSMDTSLSGLRGSPSAVRLSYLSSAQTGS